MPIDQLRKQLMLNPGKPVAETARGNAAVSVVLRPGPDILFIRRSDREGDPWSGHMAFPGGRHSETDPDLQRTAMRETWEEVGLSLDDVHLVGPLDDLVSPVRRASVASMVIRPYVFTLAEDPRLAPNEEVASTHWFSLQRLISREGRGTMMYNWNDVTYELPCLRLDGATIWGITLRVVDDLLDRIAPESS